MKIAVVTTTINYPKNLIAIQQNAAKYGHKDIIYVVAGDLKTPLITVSGPWNYLSIKAQELMANDLHAVLPLNSVGRRNFAILWAYNAGADIIITVDDDNWPGEEDFIGQHKVGYRHGGITYTTKSNWFNVLSLFPEVNFYPRGYPVGKRNNRAESSTLEVAEVVSSSMVVVNAGLWCGDPDIDSVTRLALGNVTIPQKHFSEWSGRISLQNCWCPFNSQNTALHRSIIPAYFLSPAIHRYDDIWASYIIERIAEHFSDTITFGLPIVTQDRNQHNIWSDFENEKLGLKYTDVFCDFLRGTRLYGKTYHECFGEIITEFRKFAASPLEVNLWIKIEGLIEGMEAWHSYFEGK